MKSKSSKVSERASHKDSSEATTSKNFEVTSKPSILFKTLHNFNSKSKLTVLYFTGSNILIFHEL